MNDSNPTTNLRIEGRPTAVAGRVVHFGSLVIELAPEAPTPNLQTHCVLHAQLHLDGGSFAWRQIDSAFQVIGQIAQQRSEPAASPSATPNQPPSRPAAAERPAPGPGAAARAEQALATHDPVTAGAATASPKAPAGAGGTVSAFQKVSQRPAPGTSAGPTQSPNQASKLAPPPAGNPTAAPKGDPYGSLVAQRQTSRSSATSTAASSPAGSSATSSAGAAGQAKGPSGGSAFAQLVGQGAARGQASSAGGAVPNTGFRAGGDDDPAFQDVPF